MRRFFLELEDPRTLGLFRIVFAFLVICNINDLWEHFVFLFTDEAFDQIDHDGDGNETDVFLGLFDAQENQGDHVETLELVGNARIQPAKQQGCAKRKRVF